MEKAFELYNRGGRHTSSFRHQLAPAFHDAFKLTGDIGCLDHAIQLYRELLGMQPEGHIYRYSSLYALGKALRAHSEKTGQPEHIEETILIHKEALALTREGEHSWHSTCYKLSLSLAASYKHTRRYAHLEEAIGIREQALDLRPVGDPDRPQSCNQLAVLLLTQFRYTGDGLALDRAIGLHREALAILPEAHTHRYVSYRALGKSLVARFGQTGTHLVLQEAIENYRRALALTPKGHPSRYWSCMHLAESLCILFKVSTTAKSPSESPLPEAIELHREALDLHSASQGHKERGDRSYYNLAESLSARFSENGDDAIGREALELHQKALGLRPEGHRRRNISCYALAKCLRRLFPEDRGSKADEMLGLLDEALRLGTRADPLCWRILLARAEIFLSLGRYDKAVSDLHDVLSSPQHDIPELLAGSLELLALISLDNVSSSHLKDLRLTYNNALDLLFVSTGFALDRSSQLQRVAGGTNIGARAFAISHRMGDLPAGLAVLERARGVIWSQALYTRNPQLDGVPPDLQKKLQDILRATSLTQSGEWDSEDVESSYESETLFSTQDVLHQQHTQLQRVISDIRHLPDLGDFMRGPNAQTLSSAATKNTVIVLVADEIKCHALVIRSPDEPMSTISLDITACALQELTHEASASSRRGTHTFPTEDDRLGLRARPKARSSFHAKLAKVWRIIVKPVIGHLQLGVRDFMLSVNE
jgi:tetratricopeptide (TPR) repeat protein